MKYVQTHRGGVCRGRGENLEGLPLVERQDDISAIMHTVYVRDDGGAGIEKHDLCFRESGDTRTGHQRSTGPIQDVSIELVRLTDNWPTNVLVGARRVTAHGRERAEGIH